MRRILALTSMTIISLAGAGASSAAWPSEPVGPRSFELVGCRDVGNRSDPDRHRGGGSRDDPATFRPTDPLTRGELADAFAALGKRFGPLIDPAHVVTMRELDARLVGAVGLQPAAQRIRIAARDAGLAPTSMLGTETVARLLGFRLNHPQAQEELELLPSSRRREPRPPTRWPG